MDFNTGFSFAFYLFIYQISSQRAKCVCGKAQNLLNDAISFTNVSQK
jgi:hypothetical protein